MLNRLTAIVVALLLAGECCAQDITTGLVGHWKFQDNAASTTVVGEVGGNITLAGGDNTSVKSDSGPGGALPLSLHLNGSDDNITVGATTVGAVDLFADTDSWTVALWAKIDASHGGTFAAKGSATAANRTFQLFTNTTDGTRYNVTIRGTNTAFNRTEAFAQAWRHLCVTYDGAAAVFYIDGASAGACGVGTAAHESTENIKFGARTNVAAVFFDGSLADARIYSRALSAEDVRRLFVQNFNPVQKIVQLNQ